MSWSSFTLDDVVRTYEELRAKCLYSRLMEERISRNEARGGGGLRTADADRSALNSFMRFTGGEDVPIKASFVIFFLPLPPAEALRNPFLDASRFVTGLKIRRFYVAKSSFRR